MKILLVTGIFPPDNGGPATYVPFIASELMCRGHQVLGVITLSDSNSIESGKHNFPFSVFRVPRKVPRGIRFVWVIVKIMLLARRADVVYLNGLVLEGIIATKILGNSQVVIKVVGDLIWEKARNSNATSHNLDHFQTCRQPPFWEFLKRLQTWYTSKADAIIVPSLYLSRVVMRWKVEKKKIFIVRNSVNVLISSQINRCKSEFDLVTVARLVPWKGIDELISLSAKNKWKLKIIGDGPLASELKKNVLNLNATEIISFVGKVSRERVIDEIRAAKIFVLNSTYEGLPHIVLEAKAAGVPVIATDAGGTCETISDGVNGYLVRVGDLDQIESKIKSLLCQPLERDRLVKTGLNQIYTEFSSEKMIEDTEFVLNSVISKRDRGI